MGVPKFYRWISERYPCLSEVVKEFQIPAFDNLYLDMNGIIHPCSHPNDEDPHFRISEENIFSLICNYIEFVFKMIKPRKVFFMAVDGVAPRAKMNQQRGRRFRTAKAALTLEEQAKAMGEQLPTEARFDSNCITPGTPFMVRLQQVLKDFVVHKISSDKLWQNIRVYLSGHETPGEGEHKIMDFIRYEKSQPGYNPNTRHCLYGLDADLIMLGLCSHEPHFSLLREEVKFGGNKKKQKRLVTAEETTFHLLHLSLLRDYLGHEFSPVKQKIKFDFDLEKIIDDFVLMSFLVGNDFIPHLPQLHIHHDALPVLFRTYVEVLPELDGYINEEGNLNLERFQTFLTKLAEYDFKKFGEMSDDFQYLEKKSSKSKKENGSEEKSTADLLTNLGFSNLAVSKTTEFDTSSEEETSDDESMLEMEFNMHKTDYYKNKLEFEEVTPEVLRDQAEGYVRAIQWNLHYYYDGVPSWSWYYPHHYSPFISDLKNFKNMKMKFDLGKPFLPFQQLLSVLPTLSKELLPESYQKLMCDENSPLIDFYPEDFMTDLNGKQQEWEAVVLIPFINERLLVKCSNLADAELSAEERLRNHHGPHFLYTYTEKRLGPLPSFLPKHYPALLESHALVQEIHQDFFRLPSHSIVKGLCDGVILDKFLLGFPTLRTLQHTAILKNEKVKVFQMVSQKENMMLTICESVENDINKLCEKILGKSVYVGWPHLQEALVVAISNGDFNYIFERDRQSKSIRVIEEKMSKDRKQTWERQCETVQENLYQRWGIFVGHINVLVHVRCFSGSKYVISRDNKVVEEKQFEGNTTNFALQTIVSNMQQFSPDVKEEKTAEDIFNVGSDVFVLTSPYYGCKGKIIENINLKSKGCLLVDIEVTTEPDLLPIMQNEEKLSLEQFMPGYIVAQQLGIDSHFVSRITGTLLIQTSPKVSSNPNRANIGLNLKSNRKNEEVQGFTRRIENQWQYSAEVVTILQAYLEKFADFFERLYQCRNSDVAHIEDLYPEGEGAQVLKDISSWLKEQTCTLADRQTCGIKRLDTGIVAAIEGSTKNVPSTGFHIKMELTPKQLFNPYLCKGVYMPDSKVVFALYDRVTNVSSSSSVPLGFKGTIIGIHTAEKEADSIYEIIFDSEFSTGLPTTTGGKKLYRLPPNCLINLSHGERMKMRVTSPSKTSKSKNRNAVFEKTIQRLNTDKPAQVQILQKRSPAISIQNKPFYKADSVDIFSTRTSDKQFLSGNTAFSPTSPSNAHFIIPKTSPLCNPNENLSQRNASNNVQYEKIWNGLKKNCDSPTKQSTSAPKQEYGRKVSVEELFKGLQTHSNQIPKPVIPNSENQNSQNNPKDILYKICKDHMNKTPVYTYHNYGGTNLFVCTITLPIGEEVSSLPCPSKFDAAADASEKALAFLHSSAFFHSPKTRLHSIQDNPMIQRRPLPPPNTGIIHQFNKFPSGFVARMPHVLPPNFPPPPPFGIPPFVRPMEVPVMRNPPPMHTTYIPDSYVKANLMYNEPAIPPPKAAPETGEAHVFHLGGGATAVIRPDKASPMFVPAQVMKQAVGKTTTEVKLSKTEWPDLPEKDSQPKWPSDVQQKTTPSKSSETSESLKTVSDNLECIKAVKETESQLNWSSDVQRNTMPSKSNESCESVEIVPDNSECTKAVKVPKWVKSESHLVLLTSNNTSKEKLKPTHPPGMTVLKGKRKNRLAANFQNA